MFITHKNPMEQLKRIKPAAVMIPGGGFQSPPETIDAPIVIKDLDLRQYHAYKAALDYARENKLPTLGICAGMQYMGVMLGGKTSPRRINDTENPIHRACNSKDKNLIHPVDITPESLLHKVIGRDKMDTRSRHNYSLSENFIDNFNVVARAPDGVIEAIEPKNPWNEFVLGVQWHPEDSAATDLSCDDAKIFRAFANAITKATPN
jgi:putative glutamine amidotransferase